MDLNFKSFVNNFMFEPKSPALTPNDQSRAKKITIAVGIATFGLFHASVAIINLIRFKGRITKEIPENEAVDRARSISLERFPVKKPELPVCEHLLTPEEVEKLGYTDIVHELCGIDLNGDDRECTFERLQEIVADLKERNCLSVLNTIPNFYHEKRAAAKVTPLSRWISLGNLEAVQLLVENGAALRIEDKNAPLQLDRLYFTGSQTPQYKSALFQAVKHYQVEIVRYLLENGASANFAFNNNQLRSFIPVLIFDKVEARKLGIIVTDEARALLELIFKSLSKEELKHQFQIPVSASGTRNILEWVRSREDFPGQQALVELLEAYGADEKVYTLNELRDIGNVGSGDTLDGISSFKN